MKFKVNKFMDNNKNSKDIEQYMDINDVKVGMYIENVFTEDGKLLISENQEIENTEQVKELKKQGVKKVRINLAKGRNTVKMDPEPDEISEDDIQERAEAYYKELDKAVKVHQDGVIRVSGVLHAIREGQSFSISTIKNVAENIVESLHRNPDALASLSQLKGYDNYTYIHSVNVAILVTTLAKALGYTNERLVDIGIGGLLHDVGKMRVPQKILNKPGKLSDTEFAVIKRHPEFGIDSILDHRGMSDIARKVMLQHHERYNGKGYPYGIKGERIHEVGLISAVADVYDALTSDRVYKAAWTPQKALAMIFKGCDRDYSRRIVELFTKHMGVYPVGSFVKLNSGELGVVIRVDKGRLLAPVLLVLFDGNGKRLSVPQKMELWEKQGEKDGKKYRIEASISPKAFNVDVGDIIRRRF